MTNIEKLLDTITGNRWRKFVSLILLGMMIQLQGT